MGIDFEQSTENLLAMAGTVGKRFACSVLLLHVAAPDPSFVGYKAGPQSVRENRADELREEHRRLQALAHRLRTDGIDAKALLVEGPTVETILAEADKVSADMLIVAANNRGPVARALLGSTSEQLVRRSAYPVLVVPGGGRGEAKPTGEGRLADS